MNQNQRDIPADAQIDGEGEKNLPDDTGKKNNVQNKFNPNCNTQNGFGQLPAEQFPEEYLRLIKVDLDSARAHRHEMPDDGKRGLSDETLAHFNFGYIPDYVLTKSRAQWNCGIYVDKNTGEIKRLPPPSQRIIIPTDDGEHFNAVVLPSDRKRIDKKYWKQHAGTKRLFGDKESVADADVVIVVEGEFDAASIWQATGGKVAVVAILGCGNWKNTLQPNLSTLLKGKRLILLLDADQSGRKESDKLRAELEKLAVPAVSRYLYDEMSFIDGKQKFNEKVDANDILRKRGNDTLKILIDRIIDGARDDLSKAKNEIAQQNLFNTNAGKSSANRPTSPNAGKSGSQPTVGGKTKPVVTAEITNIARAALKAIPVAQIPESTWTELIWSGRASGLTLEELDTWSRNDSRYDSAAVKNRFDRYDASKGLTVKRIIEVAKTFDFDETAAQIELLKAKLSEVEKAGDDFNREEKAALEKLRDVEKFDSDTVFADEIIKAAAFAYLDDRQTYSNFRRDLKNYGDKHKDEKVAVNDWLREVKACAGKIEKRKRDLLSKRNKIQAQIDSLSFVGKNNWLSKIKIPWQYSVSEQSGIKKIDGKEPIDVCLRPIVISEHVYCVDEKISKLVLCFQTTTGKWRQIPAAEKAVVFNRNRLIDLANVDLPVTSANAYNVVEYLDAFNVLNENNLSLSYLLNRGGWREFNGKDYFIDPRRETITTNADGKNITVKVDTSRNEFAQHLKSKGSLDDWKKAYLLAKKSPVARLMVAAAVAPPLLKILGERNFLLYVFASTRAGKTTALYLGTSAVGDEKVNRSFDATKNGLAGAAADVTDYVFPIDEKQVADNRIREQTISLVYALANGVGRTKLNRDSTLKKVFDWRTIIIATGETELLPDNVTGGANTRLMSVKAPKEILPAADCKIIRDTIRENYGLAFPLVVDKIFQFGEENLREMFDQMTAAFEDKFPETLPEHRRYMAVITLADALLNSALFGNTITTTDGYTIKPSEDAVANAVKIFPLIPTTAEISDTPREKDFVRSFIGLNQGRFVGGTVDVDTMREVWGKLNDDDGFTYVAAKALKDACQKSGMDYRKLVADLVADGFFKPADKIEKGHKTPLATVTMKIEKALMRCHRIPKRKYYEREETAD